jgi:hypothetical protein
MIPEKEFDGVAIPENPVGCDMSGFIDPKLVGAVDKNGRDGDWNVP